MRSSRHRKAVSLLGLSIVLFLLLLGTSPTIAQCVMCGQAVASAGEDPAVASTTFARAILVLLVPTVALLTTAGLLLWKFRGDPGGTFQPFPLADEIHPAKSPLPTSATPLRRRKRSS